MSEHLILLSSSTNRYRLLKLNLNLRLFVESLDHSANERTLPTEETSTEAMECTKLVTCTAPVNIAVIKYWGKRDTPRILPINSSISVTLGQDQMRAQTTVAASPDFTADRIWLNGKEESIRNPRVQRVLQQIRERAVQQGARADIAGMKVHVCSENNFPTAAGLASSAAGYACLVSALSQLHDLKGNVSDIARLGSGSACRSMFGGFVEWHMGSAPDGSDSVAVQIAPENHWPALKTLILVVSDQMKGTSSTSGMDTSVQTSALLQHRARNIVPERCRLMREAILKRDFKTFAEITMKDSNQFHACCLDTYPPISYLRDTSHLVIQLVHFLNRFWGAPKVAYTFDAGPNACLYLLEEAVPAVVAAVRHLFGAALEIRGLENEPSDVDVSFVTFDPRPGAIKYGIYTQAGPGPRVLSDEDSLLDAQGLPTRLAQ